MQAGTHSLPRCSGQTRPYRGTRADAHNVTAALPGACPHVPRLIFWHIPTHVLVCLPLHLPPAAFRPYPAMPVCGGASETHGGSKGALGTDWHLLLTLMQHGKQPSASQLEALLQLSPSPAAPGPFVSFPACPILWSLSLSLPLRLPSLAPPQHRTLSAVSPGSPIISPGGPYPEVFCRNKSFQRQPTAVSHPGQCSAEAWWHWGQKPRPQLHGAWRQAGRKEGEKLKPGAGLAGPGNSDSAGPWGGFGGEGAAGLRRLGPG